MGRRVRATPDPFAYPTTPHVRRHGPYGYRNYEPYRDWLRDEFSFRCVFCLRREQWGLLLGAWDIDHFAPQSSHPQNKLEYENLLYTCHTCNVIKRDQAVSDPCKIAFGHCLKVHEDGTIDALNENGEALIEQLRLNSAKQIGHRRLIIDTLRSLILHDRQTYIQWMRYPDNLPDLTRLRPPGNSKPDGVNDSCYARRMRGELLEVY